MTGKPEVLIVGAGPTGLVLALECAYEKVPFKIIDKAKGPGETSRAMLVVPRVLESYQKFGLSEDIIGKSIKVQHIHYHLKDKRKATIELGHIGRGKSAYPFILTFPQDEHERLLLQKLKAYGVEVEWETELDSLEDKGSHVEVAYNNQTHQYAYVIGCDGASSQVRKEADLSFEGETYEEVFYVMDADLDGDILYPDSASFSFSKNNLTLFFPLKQSENKRVIGMFPPHLRKNKSVTYEAIKKHIEKTHQVRIQKKNEFSTYAIHRRIASQFRKNRVLLAGDAAHIHSPVGGQGMNAGIGDAVNLGWKLASVVKGQADPDLLDTYEAERKGFAEWLGVTTDRAFKQLASSQTWKQKLRDSLIPLLAQGAKRSHRVRKRMYTVISQLYVTYKNSQISEGQYGKMKAGMRLPFTDGETLEFVREDGWQLHLFQKAEWAHVKSVEELGVPVIYRKWTDKTKKTGFKKDGSYLVRPDGHIGWVGKNRDGASLEAYVNKQIKKRFP